MHNPRIAVLVLAAGGGTRLGGGKMLLTWHGAPIIAHTLHIAQQLPNPVAKVCVLGHASQHVRTHLAHHQDLQSGWTFIVNQNWNAGQSTSLKAGITWLQAYQNSSHTEIDGVLIFLGDQPVIQHETISLLYSAFANSWNTGKTLAVAPYYNSQRGNPVLFAKALFPALAAVNGDKGARDILLHLESQLLAVTVDDPGVCYDIDTPQDYALLHEQPFPAGHTWAKKNV